MIKIAAPGFESGPGIQSTSVAAYHTRPVERLAGPRPGSLVQPRSGPRANEGYARAGRAHGVVTARSPRAGLQVAYLSVAWWWLVGGKVYPGSISGAPGWRRARRSGAALTRTAWSSGEASG
jgi:hypothetical protein